MVQKKGFISFTCSSKIKSSHNFTAFKIHSQISKHLITWGAGEGKNNKTKKIVLILALRSLICGQDVSESCILAIQRLIVCLGLRGPRYDTSH